LIAKNEKKRKIYTNFEFRANEGNGNPATVLSPTHTWYE